MPADISSIVVTVLSPAATQWLGRWTLTGSFLAETYRTTINTKITNADTLNEEDAAGHIKC